MKKIVIITAPHTAETPARVRKSKTDRASDESATVIPQAAADLMKAACQESCSTGLLPSRTMKNKRKQMIGSRISNPIAILNLAALANAQRQDSRARRRFQSQMGAVWLIGM
jgi:hypothetical protein